MVDVVKGEREFSICFGKLRNEVRLMIELQKEVQITNEANWNVAAAAL